MTADHRQRRVVIGIGNTMRRDDGVGPMAIGALRNLAIAGCDLVELDGESTRIIETWRDREFAVVIDAIRAGAEPGAVHQLSIDELNDVRITTGTTSSHAAGIADALALGRSLGRLPDELLIFGIEPASLDHGSGLSPAVEAAMAELLHLVRQALANDRGVTRTGSCAVRRPEPRAQPPGSGEKSPAC